MIVPPGPALVQLCMWRPHMCHDSSPSSGATLCACSSLSRAGFHLTSGTGVMSVTNLLCTCTYLEYCVCVCVQLSVEFTGNQASVAAAVYINNMDLCSWSSYSPPYFNRKGVFHWNFINLTCVVAALVLPLTNPMSDYQSALLGIQLHVIKQGTMETWVYRHTCATLTRYYSFNIPVTMLTLSTTTRLILSGLYRHL